jgi:hypothetical protein
MAVTSANGTNGGTYVSLIASLLHEFEASDRTKAILPSGRRAEVVSALTHLMADAEAFHTYVAALEGERRRRGREVERQLLGMDGLEIPDAHIAAEGFGGLSDDQLADIALAPNALRAIREYLDDPETEWGDWLTDKILEVESARPDAAERARRAQQIYQGLRNIGLLGTEKPDTIAMVEEKEQRRPSLRSLLRPGPGLLALAASLLVGVLLGGLAFRGGGLWPSTGETEVLLASVTPKFGTLRGAEQSLLVEVGSVRPGFATIITLAPDRPQQVFPEPGEEPIRIKPSARETYGPLPRDSTTALVLITETPATDLIREALLSQEFRAGDLDRLDGYLRKLLSQSGYRSVGMSYTPIVQGEKK